METLSLLDFCKEIYQGHIDEGILWDVVDHVTLSTPLPPPSRHETSDENDAWHLRAVKFLDGSDPTGTVFTDAIGIFSEDIRAGRDCTHTWTIISRLLKYPGAMKLDLLKFCLSFHIDSSGCMAFSTYNGVPVKSFKYNTESAGEDTSPCIDMNSIVDAVVEVLRCETEWSVYIYTLTHLEKFLCSCGPVRGLLNTQSKEKLVTFLCDTISSESVASGVTNVDASFKKSEMYVFLVRSLGVLAITCAFLGKMQFEDVVRALLMGIHKWPVTSKPSIQAITLLLVHHSQAITRHVPNILLALSRVTAVHLAPVILEFLSVLSRLPDIHVNFTEEDYKRIFGISLSHILSTSLPHASASVSAEYIQALSYHVILVWFRGMDISCRRRYISFIKRHVRPQNAAAPPSQSQILIQELLIQATFADVTPGDDIQGRDLLAANENAASQKSWVQEYSIVTVRVHRPGQVLVIIRRAYANVMFQCAIMNRDLFKVLSSDEGVTEPGQRRKSLKNVFGETAPSSIDPAFFMIQFLQDHEKLLPVPDSESFKRSLAVLDKVPVVDVHKIGVLYIAPGQNTEVEILANTHGCLVYTEFLKRLGTLEFLKNTAAHTGGLDPDTDGKYIITWADTPTNTQIVFHTATLMPTDLENDPQCSLKKRHVGNDFCLVCFGSVSDDFGFDVFPGHFNFVNIIVSPVPRNPTVLDAFADLWFVVKVRTRPDLNFPCILLGSDELDRSLVVSGAALPQLIRSISLHANMLALLIAQGRDGGGYFTSHVRERLRQIMLLKTRVAEASTQSREGDSFKDFVWQ